MRKCTFILTTVALLSLLVVLFTFTAFADDAEITVTYNWYDGNAWETATPNEDGSYTLRTNKKSGDGTVNLADGTAVSKEFYGWFDEEGNKYAPGATVTFTKSTRLYEAYGITVYTAEDLRVMNDWQENLYVKLGADITLDTRLSTEWCTRLIDLNGFNIKSTANDGFCYVKRGAFILLGEGKITHAPESESTSADRGFVWFDGHGYGDTGNPQLYWIGKDVEIETPYNLLYEGGRGADNMPNMVIAGKISARALMRVAPTLVNARCYIASSAVIDLTTNLFEFKNTTGTAKYMDVTLDGTINVADGKASIFTDFALEKIDFHINGGKLCVSAEDAKNIAYYLSDALMLKETVADELTWYEIVASDCVHNWVKNEEKSQSATVDSLGEDVFDCTVCGRGKSVVTAYDPSNAEVTITVADENGNTSDVVVLAKDVLVFDIMGVGENTKFAVIGVKGTDLISVSSIVAVEIPAGVSLISMTNANDTLQTINIVDGANVSVITLAGLKGIKTINIGAANVVFNSTGSNTSLEAVYSNVAGATVTFNDKCFDGKSNIKYLTMSNSSSYIFGKNSFQRTGVETVIFPDEATVRFAGEAAFYNAATKYVYFGNSITEVKNKPFDCANNLELVVLKAVTFIDQYCFCVSGANNSTAVLRVYCHSENISINNNAFVNRHNNGVEFYTVDPDIKSLSGCKYTVYNGIAHAYTENIVKESTCVEAGLAEYVTDCVCGVNAEVSYTVYTAEGSTEASTAQRELPLSDVHVLGTELANIDYKDGYLATGTKEYYCALCHTATVIEEEPSAQAIVVYYGYSVATYGEAAIMQKYDINQDAYAEYRGVNPSFVVGTVAAVNLSGEEYQPLTVEDGVITPVGSKVVIANFDITVNKRLEIKIKGVADDKKDVNIVFCTFVYDGEKIGYIEGNTVTESATGRSYNSVIQEAN